MSPISATNSTVTPTWGQTPVRDRGLSPVVVALLALLAISPLGCARRAYTDVYVENMAAEIRDLEDQLYEYDGEYRLMEQQLKALKSENSRLKGAMPSQGSMKATPAQPETFVPRSGSGNSTTSPSDNANIVPFKSSPNPAPSIEISPPEKSSTPAQPPAGSPSGPPSLNPAMPLPAPKNAPGSNSSDPMDLKDLSPPTIEQGEPMPPLLPAPKRDTNTPVTLHSENDLEVELGRVTIPAQLASDKSSRLPSPATIDQARIHPPAEMPSDARIVEMKFHPTLCKAVNTDQQDDEDALYLVLQPLNEQGEFVPLPADLMVMALDLSRDEKHATIGRWTLSTNDVKSKIQPIGSSQGIHVSLPFSGPAPQCDRLLVFAYYTLSDGRRIVAEQEVLLNNFHRQSSVWVPRAKASAAVRTASAEGPAK